MDITKGPLVVSVELILKGKMDIDHAESVGEAVAQAVAEGATRVILNMSEITYLSSAGIRVLISCYKQLSNDGKKLLIRNPSTPARMVLDLSGLQDLLTPSAV